MEHAELGGLFHTSAARERHEILTTHGWNGSTQVIFAAKLKLMRIGVTVRIQEDAHGLQGDGFGLEPAHRVVGLHVP